VIYALSFSDNTLIWISESTPLLIQIAEKQWIFTNNHSYKYSTANQWIIHWFLFREHANDFENHISVWRRRSIEIIHIEYVSHRRAPKWKWRFDRKRTNIAVPLSVSISPSLSTAYASLKSDRQMEQRYSVSFYGQVILPGGSRTLYVLSLWRKSLRHRLRSTWCYECFEAFFDWLICKILSSDWSIECFEAFVASSGPHPILLISRRRNLKDRLHWK